MSWIGSITTGVKDFFNEFSRVHYETGSSIVHRVGSVWQRSGNGEQPDATYRQVAPPIFSALLLHVVSDRSYSDIRAFEERIEQVITEGNYEWLKNHEFRIGLGSIVDQPDTVLDKLAKHIEHHPGEPLNVKFLNKDGKAQRGLDAGGLSRQLISDLFQEIKRSEIIQFEELENGRLLPTARGEPLSKSEMVKWEQIGRVLEYCIEKSGLLIGPIFEEGFFDALKVLVSTDVGNDFDSLLSVYKSLRKDDEAEIQMINRFESLVNADSLSEKEKTDAYFMLHPEEIKVGDVTNIQSKLREQMVNIFTPKIKKYTDPLRYIVHGFKSRQTKQMFSSSQGLCEKLQGKIDSGYVLQHVKCSDTHPNKQFMIQWIEESSVNELRAFIKAATGASALGKQEINVASSDSSMACFHTCGNQIDLPTRKYNKYIDFKAMLTLSIEYGLAGGFQSL